MNSCSSLRNDRSNRDRPRALTLLLLAALFWSLGGTLIKWIHWHPMAICILFTLAIRHVTAVEALLVPMIEPVLNPFWAFLFLGEIPGRFALLGGLVILGSVIVRGLVLSRRG